LLSECLSSLHALAYMRFLKLFFEK